MTIRRDKKLLDILEKRMRDLEKSKQDARDQGDPEMVVYISGQIDGIYEVFRKLGGDPHSITLGASLLGAGAKKQVSFRTGGLTVQVLHARTVDMPGLGPMIFASVGIGGPGGEFWTEASLDFTGDLETDLIALGQNLVLDICEMKANPTRFREELLRRAAKRPEPEAREAAERGAAAMAEAAQVFGDALDRACVELKGTV